MMHLEVDQGYTDKIDPAKLRHAAEEALKHEGKSPQSELTLVITDDDHLQRLNEQFLGIEAPTDVLSFPDGDIDPDTGEPYLGDILISFPRAEVQAGTSNHSIEQELQLLVVHGVLHLLGYDHAEPESKERMWAAQEEIFARLDVFVDISAYE